MDTAPKHFASEESPSDQELTFEEMEISVSTNVMEVIPKEESISFTSTTVTTPILVRLPQQFEELQIAGSPSDTGQIEDTVTVMEKSDTESSGLTKESSELSTCPKFEKQGDSKAERENTFLSDSDKEPNGRTAWTLDQNLTALSTSTEFNDLNPVLESQSVNRTFTKSNKDQRLDKGSGRHQFSGTEKSQQIGEQPGQTGSVHGLTSGRSGLFSSPPETISSPSGTSVNLPSLFISLPSLFKTLPSPIRTSCEPFQNQLEPIVSQHEPTNKLPDSTGNLSQIIQIPLRRSRRLLEHFCSPEQIVSQHEPTDTLPDSTGNLSRMIKVPLRRSRRLLRHFSSPVPSTTRCEPYSTPGSSACQSEPFSNQPDIISQSESSRTSHIPTDSATVPNERIPQPIQSRHRSSSNKAGPEQTDRQTVPTKARKRKSNSRHVPFIRWSGTSLSRPDSPNNQTALSSCQFSPSSNQTASSSGQFSPFSNQTASSSSQFSPYSNQTDSSSSQFSPSINQPGLSSSQTGQNNSRRDSSSRSLHGSSRSRRGSSRSRRGSSRSRRGSSRSRRGSSRSRRGSSRSRRGSSKGRRGSYSCRRGSSSSRCKPCSRPDPPSCQPDPSTSQTGTSSWSSQIGSSSIKSGLSSSQPVPSSSRRSPSSCQPDPSSCQPDPSSCQPGPFTSQLSTSSWSSQMGASSGKPGLSSKRQGPFCRPKLTKSLGQAYNQPESTGHLSLLTESPSLKPISRFVAIDTLPEQADAQRGPTTTRRSEPQHGPIRSRSGSSGLQPSNSKKSHGPELSRFEGGASIISVGPVPDIVSIQDVVTYVCMEEASALVDYSNQIHEFVKKLIKYKRSADITTGLTKDFRVLFMEAVQLKRISIDVRGTFEKCLREYEGMGILLKEITTEAERHMGSCVRTMTRMTEINSSGSVFSESASPEAFSLKEKARNLLRELDGNMLHLQRAMRICRMRYEIHKRIKQILAHYY